MDQQTIDAAKRRMRETERTAAAQLWANVKAARDRRMAKHFAIQFSVAVVAFTLAYYTATLEDRGGGDVMRLFEGIGRIVAAVGVYVGITYGFKRAYPRLWNSYAKPHESGNLL